MRNTCVYIYTNSNREAYIRLQRKFKVNSDWYYYQLTLIIFEYAPFSFYIH